MSSSPAPAQVHVEIPGMDVVAGNYVNFRLAMSRDGESWFCVRRYQDFVRLHSAVQASVRSGGRRLAGELPELPPKSSLMRMGQSRFEDKFLQERRAGLEAYLQRLLALLSPEECDPLDDFLLYAQHCLREAVEHLEATPALSGVARLLRDAIELGPQSTARRASEGEEGEEGGGGGGGPASPAPAAASSTQERDRRIVALASEAAGKLGEHLAGLKDACEDKEAKAESIGSGIPVLAGECRALLGEAEEQRQAAQALARQRQQECAKERGALALLAAKVRTVAAEAARVDRECRVLEGLSASHSAASARVRGVLGGWEAGHGLGSSSGSSSSASASASSSSSPAAGGPAGAHSTSPSLPGKERGAGATAAAAAAALSKECAGVSDSSSLLRACLAAMGSFVAATAAQVVALKQGGGGEGGVPFHPTAAAAEGGKAAAAAAAATAAAAARLPKPPALTAPLSGPDLAVAALMHAAALDTAQLLAVAHSIRRGGLARLQLPTPSGRSGGGSSSSSGNSSNSSGSSSSSSSPAGGGAWEAAPLAAVSSSSSAAAAVAATAPSSTASSPALRPLPAPSGSGGLGSGNPFGAGASAPPPAAASRHAGSGETGAGNPFGGGGAAPRAAPKPAAGNPF